MTSTLMSLLAATALTALTTATSPAASAGPPIGPSLASTPTVSAATGGALHAPSIDASSATILWKGKATPFDSIEIPGAADKLAAVAKHVDRYAAWVAENGYAMALTEDARVLLITSSAKVAKRRLKLVSKTLSVFDEIMPAPDRTGSDETFREGDWGVCEHVPDAGPVVLIELEKGAHYQALLGSLEKGDPDMQTWTSVHASEPGFDEVRVMAAAWQAAPAGFEVGNVWRSENELVNRLSRMLTYRSFGPQPTWFNQATAWTVEQSVVGNIYCFPYRQEFVSVGEHSGWSSTLKGQFNKRKKEPLELGEFAGWRRNSWDLNEAALSWGFVQFLAKHKPGSLPALAEANRLAYKAGFTVDHGDGTWSTNPNFEVPKASQLETLESIAGEEVLDEASEFFRKGRRYKPSRKRR
ncbi:MAG: hypothetical protein ACJAZN_003195 [Planctomycetota bacterium]|jgi:hypothetical protein